MKPCYLGVGLGTSRKYWNENNNSWGTKEEATAYGENTQKMLEGNETLLAMVVAGILTWETEAETEAENLEWHRVHHALVNGSWVTLYYAENADGDGYWTDVEAEAVVYKGPRGRRAQAPPIGPMWLKVRKV